MSKTGGSERDQDRQHGFGAVSRGPETVEPHRRHALERADLPLDILLISASSAVVINSPPRSGANSRPAQVEPFVVKREGGIWRASL